MKLQALLTELHQLARYGLVGVASNALLYCLYLLALKIGLAPSVATGLSFGFGTAFSFVLNRAWTFKSQGARQSDLVKFLIAYGIGFLFTIAAIRLLTRWMPPELAQLPNIALTAVLIYMLLRCLRFGKADV